MGVGCERLPLVGMFDGPFCAPLARSMVDSVGGGPHPHLLLEPPVDCPHSQITERRDADRAVTCHPSRIIRPWAVLLVATWLFVGLGSATASTGQKTWIGIGGAATPGLGYSLAIGSDAWTITMTADSSGGVTSLILDQPIRVTVWRLQSCQKVLSFDAKPGRDYYIRLGSDGSAAFEDWTGVGMDAGPALGAPGPAVCQLPDTSASPDERTPGADQRLSLIIGTGCLSLAFAAFRPRWRRARAPRRV